MQNGFVGIKFGLLLHQVDLVRHGVHHHRRHRGLNLIIFRESADCSP